MSISFELTKEKPEDFQCGICLGEDALTPLARHKTVRGVFHVFHERCLYDTALFNPICPLCPSQRITHINGIPIEEYIVSQTEKTALAIIEKFPTLIHDCDIDREHKDMQSCLTQLLRSRKKFASSESQADILSKIEHIETLYKNAIFERLTRALEKEGREEFNRAKKTLEDALNALRRLPLDADPAPFERAAEDALAALQHIDRLNGGKNLRYVESAELRVAAVKRARYSGEITITTLALVGTVVALTLALFARTL